MSLSRRDYTFTVRVVQPREQQSGLVVRYIICHSDWSGVLATFASYVDFNLVKSFAKQLKENHGDVRIYDTFSDEEIK